MGGAAAAVLIKERHIVGAFERAGAVSVERAAYPPDINVDPGGIGWRRLHSRAVVREAGAGSGKFYVDLEVWQALRRMRRRMLVAVLILVAVFALLTSGLLFRG